MPKYDYRCSGCGSVYEKREGFDAPALQECPSCGSEARRVLTPPAIVFKGSGWYATDSRKGSSSDSVSASATPAATASNDGAATSSTPAKAESTPAKSDSAVAAD